MEAIQACIKNTTHCLDSQDVFQKNFLIQSPKVIHYKGNAWYLESSFLHCSFQEFCR